MELQPLTQFVCDACGEIIENPAQGWLEWQVSSVSGERKLEGFRIIHYAPFSPRRARKGGRCNYPSDGTVQDTHLEQCLGVDGLARLLAMLERFPQSSLEIVEIIRRLHVPFYEEARRHWEAAESDGLFDGANEYYPYMQEVLTTVIERYRTPDTETAN